MNDRVFITALELLPKNAFSRLIGAATRLRLPGPICRLAMRLFASRYGIDLTECSELTTFRTFSEFFARPLKPGLRPITPGERVVVSPVDALVSELGVSEQGRLIQAKGLDYTLEELLADAALARRLQGGVWATLYLSPRDYHRIHFPLSGKVVGFRYVPGSLWPVNSISVRNVPKLFCVNERLVTVLDSPLGLCAVVAVGATVVGRVCATFDPTIPRTNLRRARPVAHDYAEPKVVEKGSELGAFEMGSTVILVFEPGKAGWLPELRAGIHVRVGMPIGGAQA